MSLDDTSSRPPQTAGVFERLDSVRRRRDKQDRDHREKGKNPSDPVNPVEQKNAPRSQSNESDCLYRLTEE